jgi:hypothetical protein
MHFVGNVTSNIQTKQGAWCLCKAQNRRPLREIEDYKLISPTLPKQISLT